MYACKPLSARGSAVAGGARQRVVVQSSAGRGGKGKAPQPQTVEYGANWYEQTRAASRPKRTVREEIEYRRRANELANNGKERKDLYTDNWDGSEYKGSSFNILTLLAALFFLVPVAGLVFAFLTYGELWG